MSRKHGSNNSSREQSGPSGNKSRAHGIEEKDCPKCRHNKAWVPRGDINPTYMSKCSRCGFRS